MLYHESQLTLVTIRHALDLCYAKLRRVGYLASDSEMPNMPSCCVMKIHFAPKDLRKHGKKIGESNFLISKHELPDLCKMLQNMDYNFNTQCRSRVRPVVTIDVDQLIGLDSRSDDGTSLTMDSPYARSLLEPFRSLHSMNARVSGRVSAQYKADIEISIAKAAPSALELIDSVSRLIAQGKQASDIGDVALARSRLCEAINELEVGHSDNEIDALTGPEFHDLPAHRVFKAASFSDLCLTCCMLLQAWKFQKNS